MKGLEFLRFEVAYQLKRWWTWLYVAVIALFCFWITNDDYLRHAKDGAYHFNSPFVVASITLLGSVLGLLMAAAFAGDAGARDAQSRLDPLVYTSSATEGSYVAGRFVAAFLLSALALLGVQGGLILSVLITDAPANLLDPVNLGSYASAYLLIALPNAFLATALLFSLSLLSRRAATSYLGAVLILFVMLCSWLILAQVLGQWELAKILDPLAMTIVQDVSRSTIPAQKNTLGIASYASLLVNRAVWLGVAGLILGFTHLRFRFQAASVRTWWRCAPQAGAHVAERSAPISVPVTARATGAARTLDQLAAITSQSFRETALSWGGLALAFLAVALALFGKLALPYIGVPVLPTTERMVNWIGHPGDFLWFVVPILTTFYAGELVWRDRETRMSDIADAAPVPEWVQLAGRYAGLALTLLAYQLLLVLACVAIQVQMGYYHFEPGLYATVLGLSLTEHLLFAALAFTLHVLVNQKYAGYLVVIATYAMVVLSPSLLSHHLARFASSPSWSYSDMSGFGASLIGWSWAKGYWAAWALLLGVVATLLWVRGRESGPKARLRLFRERLTPRVVGTLAATLALIVGTGGFVFYNTNVLNTRLSKEATQARWVRYEKEYGRHASLTQPELTAIALRADIRPHEREATLHTQYTLVNVSDSAIRSIHFLPADDFETSAATYDRPARTIVDDRELGYRIHELATPLPPGDSLHVTFDVRFKPRGFTHEGIDQSVVPNGTSLPGNGWLPHIGYDKGRELADPRDREEAGLARRLELRALDDSAARHEKLPRRIAFDAVIATDADEVAVAPGELRRTWMENGRRLFHYVASSPIQNDFALHSARYALREAMWHDVTIQVLYHREHATNVDALVKSAMASLEYFTRNVGPYPYRELRLVEHAGSSNTPRSSPGIIEYEEAFAGFDPAKDNRGVDFVFAASAHEVAHQWWGLQFAPADVEGAPVLIESAAWFGTMGVVAQSLGEDHLQRLMDMMHESRWTVSSRAGGPWMRMASWFVAYRHGPFAMFALREYVGEAQVNRSLRSLYEKHPDATPPLPTTRDLVAKLRAVTPDSLQFLLGDLFERNTYWELETKAVSAAPVGQGQYRVTLDVKARKVTVDPRGTETEVALDDPVEIGVYGEGGAATRGVQLYRRLHRIKTGEQQFSIVVAGKPVSAGIDPRNLLIDAEPADNIKGVTASP